MDYDYFDLKFILAIIHYLNNLLFLFFSFFPLSFTFYIAIYNLLCFVIKNCFMYSSRKIKGDE